MSTYFHTQSLIRLLLLFLLLEIGISLNVHFVNGVPVSEPVQNNEEIIETVQLAKPATVVPLDTLRETLERPLFSQIRRRISQKDESISLAQTSKQTPILAIAPPSVQVIGIILFKDSRQALVRRNQGGVHEWISENDKIDGWTLDGLLPTQIILKNGEQIKMFSIENWESLNRKITNK
ncbi:MAG: hypothetical protein HQL89_14925 [Magnetococcales bacterium]|nr:hypothetical protein [Magnetococcales bacterium]